MNSLPASVQIEQAQRIKDIQARGFSEELAQVIAEIEALPNYNFYVCHSHYSVGGNCEVDIYHKTGVPWKGIGKTELDAFRNALKAAKEATR